MHPLSSALPSKYVPVRVTHGALVAHRHSFDSPRCRTSQYRSTSVPLSVSLFNDLGSHAFDGVGLAVKSSSNAFLLAKSALSFLSPTIFNFSPFYGFIVYG